jgi:hypothetical protein
MSSLLKAAAPGGNVEMALAEIRQTRVNYGRLRIEQCIELTRMLSIFASIIAAPAPGRASQVPK